MELLSYAQKHELPVTIPGVLERSARLYPDRKALVARLKEGDRATTYRELKDEVEHVASGLIALGLKRGDRVAILGPNSPEWAKAYLGILRAGGINVPLDSLLSNNELIQLTAKSNVRMAFAAPRFLEIFTETPDAFPELEQVFCLSSAAAPPLPGVISMDQLMETGSPKATGFPKPEPGDLAAIIFTSGTTGTPKGVMLTHWNIVSDCISCQIAIDIREERFLSVLPMHHTFECTAGFMLPLFCGCCITFARSLKSRYILEDMKASRCSVMLGVPLLFQKMMEGMLRAVNRAPMHRKLLFHSMWNLVQTAERLGNKSLGKVLFREMRKKAGLGHIRYFVVGGAPLPSYIPRFFRHLGIELLQGYGLTESSPVLTINPPEAPIDESVGKPLPGVEVRVLDPDSDGIGELAFRGPMIMKGYLDNPEATAEVKDGDGWLHTGDLGYVDKHGYVFVCGRGKNLIVTAAGKNVYPEEIESMLNKSAIILESMVYGRVAGESMAEDVCAIIVPDYEMLAKVHPEKQMDDARLRILIDKEIRAVNRELASYKRIKSFEIINEELPKTSTKKIKRHLFKLPVKPES